MIHPVNLKAVSQQPSSGRALKIKQLLGVGLLFGCVAGTYWLYPQRTDAEGSQERIRKEEAAIVRLPKPEMSPDAEVRMDFAKLHAALKRYIDRNGKLPPPDFGDPASEFRKLGELSMQDVRGPAGSWGLYHWVTDGSFRPDGTPIPARPAPGERDIWAKASYQDPKGKSQNWVLWSDGRVQEITPADRVVELGEGRNPEVGVRSFIRGEAGIAPSRVVSEADYKKLLASVASQKKPAKASPTTGKPSSDSPR